MGALAERSLQAFLPMFPSHEVQVMEEAYERRNAAKLKRKNTTRGKPKLTLKNAIDQLDFSQLDFPLGNVEDAELSTTFDPLTAPDIADGFVENGEEKMTWSDAAVDELHEGLVMYSLRLLNAKGNSSEKRSILAWIFNPDVMEVSRTEGEEVQWERINPQDVPFSFELCCRLAGYYPDRIRDGLVPILKELNLYQLWKDVNHEQSIAQLERAKKSKVVPHRVNIQYPRSA